MTINTWNAGQGMKVKLVGIIALMLACFLASAHAAVPSTISYQGYLTDSSGVAANGNYSVTFKLYDAGATELWSETVSVTVANGVFETTLGATVALPDPLLNGSTLGLSFDAGPEMTPRQNLNSTPFAIHAKTTEKDTLNSLSCTTDQSVKWSGTVWECSDVAADGVQSISTGAGLTSSGTTDVELSLDPAGLSGSQIANGQVVRGISISGNVLTDTVSLQEGSGVDFSVAGNVVAINSTLSGPTSVSATSGLTGGGSSGDIAIGIADGGVVSTHIAGDEIVKGITVGSATLKDAISLVGGDGVSISSSGNDVTFSATAPANMVTTNTDQTITGIKNFDQPLNVSGLTGDVSVGSVGEFERLEIFGELRLTNHVSDASYFEVETNNDGDTEINNPTAGGDIYILDDLYLQVPGGTTFKKLIAGDLEADRVESYGGGFEVLQSRSVGGASGGRISFSSTYGITINPDADFGDTVNITDNLRVGDDIIATDNVTIEDDLEVSGVARKPGGGQWSTLSDKRLKRNIQAMSSAEALDQVNKLNPVTFEWVNPEQHGGKTREYGFIAQEVELVFPAWVDEANTQGKDKKLVEGKAKSVNLPNEFNAYLISAIQELKKQNEALKSLVCLDRPEHDYCQ